MNHRTVFNRNALPRHHENVSRMNADRSKAGEQLATKHSPAAGATLGSSTSQSKVAAAQDNGKEGGRPSGS